MKKHNYSAGPCFTTRSFEKSAQAILDFNDSGLSILEISHRSKDFVAVMDEARSTLELLVRRQRIPSLIFSWWQV
jgi:phosphoserine aminotransferase